MTRYVRPILVGLVGGLISAVLFYALAHAQTAPAGFCGFASVATPPAPAVTNGAALTASASGTAAITPPTIPTLTAGNIVGALVQVAPSSATGVRVRTDGTNPDTSNGVVYTPGTFFTVCGSDLTTIRMVASTSGTNAITHWQFYTTGR